MKKFIEEFNDRFEQAEGRIRALENSMVENTKLEEQTRKKE